MKTMYIKLQKIHKDKTRFGFDTKVTHIGLYTDDDKFIKFIKHSDSLLDIVMQRKISITIPEIQELLQPQDIEKILSINKIDDTQSTTTPEKDTGAKGTDKSK